MQSKLEIHVGEDYLTITLPGGGQLIAKYPDDQDIAQAKDVVKVYNSSVAKKDSPND